MRWVAVCLPLSLIVGFSLYLAYHYWDWHWLITAAVALFAIAGIIYCWRRPRYAALFAAIDIATIAVVSHGLGTLTASADTAQLGPATLKVSVEGPSPWPAMVACVALLLFQAAYEFIERGLPTSLKLRLTAVTGSRNTTIQESPGASPITVNAGDITGTALIGHNPQHIEIHVDVDAEIEHAVQLMRSGRHLSAEAALQRLETRYGASLSKPQKYRVSANLAHIAVHRGAINDATTLFRRAAADAPDDRRKNTCLAYLRWLTDDFPEATRCCRLVLADAPTDDAVAHVLIMCDTSDRTTDAIRLELDHTIRESQNVYSAGVRRELRAERFQAAEALARQALSVHPGTPLAEENLAKAILARLGRKRTVETQPDLLNADEKARYSEAVTLTTSVLRHPDRELAPEHKADLLSMRGMAQWSLGKQAEALHDWDEASALSADVGDHLLPYTIKLNDVGRTDDAIAQLREAKGRPRDLVASAYLSQLLTARGQARHRWRVGRFYLWLKTNCRIVGSRALATLEPTKRERLVDDLGFSAASAIAIAADQNAALWTDEFIVARIAQEHGVPFRVWTLRVVEVLQERGAVSEQQNNDIGCDLLASGSRSFPLPDRIIARALERSSLDPNVWPLNGICQWFANGAIRPQFVLAALCSFLKMLHSRSRLASQEDAVVDAIMRALCENPARAEIGVALLGQLESLFQFEIPYRSQLAARIKRWLSV